MQSQTHTFIVNGSGQAAFDNTLQEWLTKQ